MTSRERIRRLMARQPADRCGFWLGRPHPDMLRKLEARLEIESLEGVQRWCGDDVRWIGPQHFESTYRHPQGQPMRPWKDANPHGMTGHGLLSATATPDDVERIAWPEAEFLDFGETLEHLDTAGEFYRLSGFWSPFFHDLCYLFGAEDLLCLLMERPSVVRAACERLCRFYLEANARFHAAVGDRMDALFIGNDFGTQQGLLLSPDCFREFFLPWIAALVEQAHAHGKACILHCCGGIEPIIGDLVAVGLDGLHPLQATARGMDPGVLASRYGDQLTFWGGVDTQDLLPHGTPEDVERDVLRLREAFGDRLVVGPSHEALLPSSRVENVLRMATAAHRPCAGAGTR